MKFSHRNKEIKERQGPLFHKGEMKATYIEPGKRILNKLPQISIEIIMNGGTAFFTDWTPQLSLALSRAQVLLYFYYVWHFCLYIFTQSCWLTIRLWRTVLYWSFSHRIAVTLISPFSGYVHCSSLLPILALNFRSLMNLIKFFWILRLLCSILA